MKKTHVRHPKTVPDIPCAANLSRGSAVLLVHEEEEITLVDWDRQIIVRCLQIRHLWNDSRQTFLSKMLVEIPALFNSSNFWILQIRVSRSARSRSANSSWSKAKLVLVWTCQTLFEYAQFPLLENQCVWPIHKYYFRQDPLCIQVSGSRILLLRAFVPLSFKQWSWSDSCLTCFALLKKVQWWCQRIPGVHVVNLSIWVLRFVVAKDVDCLDIRDLEEWTYFLKVFCQFSSRKILDLQHVTFLQFLHVSHIPDTSFTKIPILLGYFLLKS